MAARAYERDGSLSGVATGLIDLDRYMGGLQASDLVILAGRPGMGAKLRRWGRRHAPYFACQSNAAHLARWGHTTGQRRRGQRNARV